MREAARRGSRFAPALLLLALTNAWGGAAGDGDAIVALVEIEAGLLPLGKMDEDFDPLVVDRDRLEIRQGSRANIRAVQTI